MSRGGRGRCRVRSSGAPAVCGRSSEASYWPCCSHLSTVPPEASSYPLLQSPTSFAGHGPTVRIRLRTSTLPWPIESQSVTADSTSADGIVGSFEAANFWGTDATSSVGCGVVPVAGNGPVVSDSALSARCHGQRVRVELVCSRWYRTVRGVTYTMP